MALLTALATLGACADDGAAGLVCPLLAPGATAQLDMGRTLGVAGDAAGGVLGIGALAGHPIALAAGQRVEIAVTSNDPSGPPLVMTYGPRDGFGGYPHCLALARAEAGGAARVRLAASGDRGGEHLVVLGAPPGQALGSYTVVVRCLEGCEQPAPCPTLAERGCGDMRCDGELAPDDAGCPSCVCVSAALCGADRAAGPAGSCVLPACVCEHAAPSPVCGVDGRTWPSPCHARCAGVGVARVGDCAFVCPALAACDAPCFGLRAIDASGCPTCECRPEFAADAASCAACPSDLAPVCGSDGVTYDNRCQARCAGARILYGASCTPGCREAPAGCQLDCPWGLRLDPTQGCVHCACAAAPSDSCSPRGAPVCVTLPGLDEQATVGSPCLALHLGASGGAWGPCGEACADDLECPEGARCGAHGFLSGRCLEEGPLPCTCAAVRDPICGADGVDYVNRCLAACAGVAVAASGPCCELDPGSCPGAEAPVVDERGCPGECTVDADRRGCAVGAATAPACAPGGEPLAETACEAHLEGLAAAPAWCAP